MMVEKKFLTYIFLIVCFGFGKAFGQTAEPVKYWMIFIDKGKYNQDTEIKPGTDAYNEGLALLSEKAVKRRLKVLSEDKLIDYADLPLNEAYIQKIQSAGIEIIAKSRWLNGVSAYLNSAQLEKVKALDFVGQIRLVNKLIKQEADAIPFAKDEYGSLYFVKSDSGKGKYKLDYGKSLRQNEVVNVPKVHNLGITGKGIMIASFDDGFGWKEHEALRNLHVLEEFDFINKDKNTYPEDNQKYSDSRDQGAHGTATISTMMGYKPGQLIGPAFDADLLLAKTEYVSSETPMEEDFWLEAAEWSEAKGVDVITSSLIYKDYYEDLDHPNSYKYENFDGNTAITTIAGDRCAYLGIAVFNSLGNYYQTAIPSLGSSADGDSVIGIGAIDYNGDPASFTSNGPTYDGRIKPDLVAPGVDVYAAKIKSESGNDKTYQFISGTSFSCPITAGIGALILSAHPELTPMQLRDALRNTANNSARPNNVLGWGTVNAYDALLYFGPAWSNSPVYTNTESGGIEVSTYLASKDVIDPTSVKMFYSVDGNEFMEAPMKLIEPLSDGNNSGRYSGSLQNVTGTMRIYFTAKSIEGKIFSYPKNAPEEYLLK